MSTVGTEAGLRLCLSELVNVIMTGLSSSSWTIKAQAGATACSVADKLGSQLGPPHLATLLISLMTALPGRTWTGKVMFICLCCRRYRCGIGSTDVGRQTDWATAFWATNSLGDRGLGNSSDWSTYFWVTDDLATNQLGNRRLGYESQSDG